MLFQKRSSVGDTFYPAHMATLHLGKKKNSSSPGTDKKLLWKIYACSVSLHLKAKLYNAVSCAYQGALYERYLSNRT